MGDSSPRGARRPVQRLPRAGLRRAARGVAWLWAVVGGLWLVLRFLDVTGPVPMLQSVLPVVGLSLVLLVVVAALARLWGPALTAGLLLVPYAVLALPWWVGSPGEAAEDDVVVMSANLLYGRADLDRLAALVQERDVSALVLLEVTPAADAALRDGPLAELLPHRSGTVRDDAGGTLVLTADEHALLPDAPVGAFDNVAVRVSSPAGEWTLLGAHSHPPGRAEATQWRSDLGWLGLWSARQPTDIPVVLAGDFNASQAHPAFRALGDGLTDAHQAAGGRWVRTWPLQGWGPVPAFVQLDHILVADMSVVDAGTDVVEGSDHAVVWARVSLPGLGRR